MSLSVSIGCPEESNYGVVKSARPVFLSNFKHLWRRSTLMSASLWVFFVHSFVLSVLSFFSLLCQTVFCLMPRSPLLTISQLFTHWRKQLHVFKHKQTRADTHTHSCNYNRLQLEVVFCVCLNSTIILVILPKL